MSYLCRDVNLLGENKNTTKKNKETLPTVSREISLEPNVGKN